MAKTTALTKEEMQLVASLRGNTGFMLLLEKIEAIIDNLEISIELEKNEQNVLQKARFWQFLRRVHRVLKSTPEEMAAELEEMRPGDREYDAAEAPGDPRVTLSGYYPGAVGFLAPNQQGTYTDK